MKEMTLKEVCNSIGVSRRTVQCYEQKDMVHSTGRNKYGYLLYDENAVKKIQDIKMHQDLGFSLKEIKELMEVSEERYIQMMKERLVVLRDDLEKLKKHIECVESIISIRKSWR